MRVGAGSKPPIEAKNSSAPPAPPAMKFDAARQSQFFCGLGAAKFEPPSTGFLHDRSHM